MKSTEKEAEEEKISGEKAEIECRCEVNACLDNWGNKCEVYESHGIYVNVCRFPIIGMRLGIGKIGPTINQKTRAPMVFQKVHFLSVMADGEILGDDLSESEIEHSSLFPPPPNSYKVRFMASGFEDLQIEDQYEFNGIRGNHQNYIDREVEWYIEELLKAREEEEKIVELNDLIRARQG